MLSGYVAMCTQRTARQQPHVGSALPACNPAAAAAAAVLVRSTTHHASLPASTPRPRGSACSSRRHMQSIDEQAAGRCLKTEKCGCPHFTHNSEYHLRFGDACAVTNSSGQPRYNWVQPSACQDTHQSQSRRPGCRPGALAPWFLGTMRRCGLPVSECARTTGVSTTAWLARGGAGGLGVGLGGGVAHRRMSEWYRSLKPQP